MSCAICERRRARRDCPGIQAEICPICCGEGREVTVACPLECVYLREARRHEKPGMGCPDPLPNSDIRASDEFLRSRQDLLEAMVGALVQTALGTEGVVDLDVRDALAALIRTYRTLATGIQYETRPANRLAAGLFDAVQETVAAFRSRETERLGMPRTRDNDVLVLLVFMQQFEFTSSNGRKRGRACLDALRGYYGGPARGAPGSASPLIFT